MTIHVVLPAHIRTLAKVDGDVDVEVAGTPSISSVLDALESQFPTIKGALRDQVTKERRAFVRFFACEEDLSHDDPSKPLPEAVREGKEPLFVVGAIAGG